MSDLLVGLGLVFVIEGLFWALAPHLGLRLLEVAAVTPEQKLRTGGAAAVAAGVFLIWLVRG
ncbi:MAG: DUF2065 domain-containing protein [Rhodomicrobium sp.]|nr:DUF2065 domain-containing protein [Rhodomicrobium sp.]